MTNSKATMVLAESLRANLKAAELHVEDISERLRADGVNGHTENFKEAWISIRNAQRCVVEGLEKAGKQQSEKLVAGLPQHGKEGAQR